MCLIDTKKFRFTFKRIPIYKIVQPAKRENRKLSPIQHYNLKRRNFTLNGFPKACNTMSDIHYIFDKGFFHAYSSKEKCAYELITGEDLIEGYIPAFTRYAIGVHGDICARRMVLKF
jgi:hypothetical protein